MDQEWRRVRVNDPDFKPALEKGFGALACGKRPEPDCWVKPWLGPWSLPADWSLVVHSSSEW